MFSKGGVFALSVFLWGIFSVPLAHAAALYIDPAFPELYRGDAVTLSVRLDVDETAEECINAVDGIISYDPALDPVDISLGDSIISLWPEKPTINREQHTITFAGGIPNGYCGRVTGDPRLTNTLLQVVLRLPSFSIGGGEVGETAVVGFADETGVYLNDGRGTRIAPALYPSTITIHKEASQNFQNAWQDVVDADNTPPQEFSIAVERIPAETGRYFAVFNAFDKESGIDQIQIMEEPISEFMAFQWGRADAPWITVQNPNAYQLKDQSLNSIIRVKAIDKAGNEYIANYIPAESMRTISQTQIINFALVGVGLTLVLVVVLVVVVLRRRRSPKNGENMDMDDEVLDEDALEDEDTNTEE